MNGMRALYDHQAFSLQDGGGISRYLFELTRAISRLDAASCDLVLGLHANRYPFSGNGNIRVLQHRGWPAGNPGIVRYGINHLVSDCLVPFRGVYDVYHPTLYRWLALARYQKMVVTHHDCTYERFPGLFKRTESIIRARALQFAKTDAIICPSASSRNDLHHFYDIPEGKSFVIHHGVARFEPAPDEERPLRQRPFLLYVGSRAEYKNFSGFLAAFAAAQLQSSFAIVAVGGGPPRAEELKQIAGEGLENCVCFVPDANDEVLAAYYRQAHLLVYPSLYEGFGLPPLEAMLCGCPVLSSNASCLPEICGPAALFFEAGSKEAFVETMRVGCFNEDRRRELKAAGRIHAEKYSWQDCARKTMNVYSLPGRPV